jgi:ABC-type antimicrobial peptide transport system permease subunit
MAIGQNILAIGDGILVDKYVSLLDPNSNASDLELQSFNFTSSRFILNETFIEGLGQLQGIEVVDTRLVTFTPVFEIQNTTAELDWVTRQTHYVITGDHRLKNCLVVGVDPAHLASSGFTQRTGVLNVENDDEAIVGDSLSEAIFQDPFKQSIRVSSNQSTDKKNFKIVNVVVDPINHGMVLYVPFSQLWELFSVDGFNLVLVKVNGASGDAVSEITSLAGQYGLVVRNLDFVRNEYAASIDEIWFSVLPFAVLSVVTAMIGLLNSMFVSVSGRTHDFGILKAIGAKPSYLIKMVFLESSIFVLVTAPIGIIIGTLCVFLFLVPGATISVLFLATSLLAIAVMLLGMCLLSTLLVVHVRKKLPHELL